MSVTLLVGGVGSEKTEQLLKVLFDSLETISKKYNLKIDKRQASNIPDSLAPILFCFDKEGKKMLLLIFDVVSTLGEARLTVPSKNLI